MTCVFCEMAKAGKAPFLENNLFHARLDIHPVSPCHTLIIPRRHTTTYDDLTVGEVVALHELCAQVVRCIEATSGSEKYRIYEAIAQEEITDNSVEYCLRAIKHPWLGSKPDGYNFGINQGERAGQTVKHFHWHVIPRYRGDMNDPTGGVRHVIPYMGNYHRPPGSESAAED